jgi:hypothetical protein
VSEPTPPPEDAPVQAPEPEPSAESKRRLVQRWTRRAFALFVAVVAAVFVSFFSLDLGRIPQLRQQAEHHGSNYLRRPLHIGAISARITPGVFMVHDVTIEGRAPTDRPFFRVRRILVNVPWWTIFRRQLHVNVRLDDWAMVLESWAGGVHNIPRLMPERSESPAPRPFTTTVDFAFAHGGHFTYEDHATPWSVVAPNLTFDLVRSTAYEEYVGTAAFHGGVVQIQNYEPMAADFRTRFELDGPIVRLRHIDLVADGSRSHITGEIDMGNWPNQFYDVSSTIDLARMKDLFFTRETWRLGGEAQFGGRFMLGKDGVRDLTGSFTSRSAVVNDVQFTGLHGDLTWLPSHFSVGHAEADVLGGHTRFRYSIAPLGAPTTPTMSFDADYSNVDLFELDRLMSLRGLRLAGAATGSLSMQWPSGRMSSGRRGIGHTVITPMSGDPLAPESLPVIPLLPAREPRPFDPNPLGRPMAVGGDLHYRFEPGAITFDDSHFSTTHSFISFAGRMESGGAAEFPFHVTSHDWQESDRLLAAIMTAVSGPTRAVEVGGRGTFDGVMTGSFSAPRIEGQFAGEHVRAWDVRWGRAVADLVIQGGYIDISNSRIGDTDVDGRLIIADGRYALGFRHDDAEEIRARVRMTNWPIVDLRHAFLLDDWPMDGTMGDLDLTLSGQYREMYGKGRMRIDNGRAWDESFETATADLELEGSGMRVSRIEMHKGPGRMFGAARIGWDGTYVFNADGEGVPVEMLDNFSVEGAPLSGRLRFKVSGAGEFETPTYTFEVSIDDLFVGDEGIGAVSGRVAIVDDVMTVERLVAASSRLQVLGTGTIRFDDAYTSDLRIRFQETALDPYLKFVLTDDVSPYTRVVVGGSLSVVGPLAAPGDLTVDTTIDDATFTLYDYDLRNDGPLQMRLADGRLDLTAFDLQGSNTNLRLSGGADVRARTLNLSAAGDASLSILQLFFQGITSAGAARLNARLEGAFDAPRLTGDAAISDGRFRPFGSPHSLEAINGRIRFASNAINLDDVTARIGSGDVTFSGAIALDGYQLADYNLTATGRSMRLRYPAGFNSTVDMRLFLTGPRDAPLLTGTVDVLRVALVGTSQSGGGLFGFATAGTAGVSPAPTSAPAASTGVPLALDIQVTAPRMRVIDNNEARIEASADLQVRGTYDAPVIEGAVDIAGGEVLFNGNRYFVREGAVDFNAGQPDPVFDLAAETRPRVSGQVFTVNVGISGTVDRITFTTSSDPWLPESDVISLLFGGTPALGTAEERSLRSSQELQQQMLQTAGAALLASPITSRVGAAFERTGAFDTVQITPVLTNEDPFQRLNPTARVTFGKRVSPRVFLTYSRTIGGLEEEIILLEYDQSDRMSWVLSRNEDRTFALDFRIRYVF